MPKNIPAINLADFSYELPEDRIAKFPLDKRDDAKLQVYVKGEFAHSRFYKLHFFLPAKTLLVFNNTKVIPARLHFSRPTGALIEVFLIQPEEPKLVSTAMLANQKTVWRCLIGNKRRWKDGEILKQVLIIDNQEVVLEAKLLDREAQRVELSWNNAEWRFVDIVTKFGEIPLPPYIKRKTTEQDKTQYQTVYSEKAGAVAAPTAGLHFTEDVLSNLEKKGIQKDFLTLHVSGGTFQPIKTNKVIEHPMHSEQLIFTRKNLENLLANPKQIVAVGTTSMRALESLYWYGVKLMKNPLPKTKGNLIPFSIEKLYPYQFENHELPPLEKSLEIILKYMKNQEWEELIGETEIFIFPSYTFRICKGLITNYHLPNTTLILLVAAFIGDDWRKVYQEALENDYRFLSYGDSSLLIP
ncbi:MAG: S-adenosylmethionine:tRNA ribosyltransferase-isomerase [Microscillaceae bacterium]|jgi:S-adenosylmethionine:tRNA ribosyltransferase-isomerase|nr:S-adenosylmethionine:tRNA ribosyltransferase-isomerase [Microscillaceae bacterium]